MKNNLILKEMAKDQLIYEEIEKGNKELVGSIDQLQKTKIALEEQIVKSPEDLLRSFEERKKTLETSKLLRTQLSSKLEQDVINDGEMLNVIEMAGHCIQVFDELVVK